VKGEADKGQRIKLQKSEKGQIKSKGEGNIDHLRFGRKGVERRKTQTGDFPLRKDQERPGSTSRVRGTPKKTINSSGTGRGPRK